MNLSFYYAEGKARGYLPSRLLSTIYDAAYMF